MVWKRIELLDADDRNIRPIELGSLLHKHIDHPAIGITNAIGVAPDWKPFFLLAIVYLVSQLFTETITNVAVASIMLTVSVSVAMVGGYDPRPFIIAVTLAASLSFVTPIGYQTNLMVMGPGGYQPRDYWRVGWPLSLLMTGSALVLIPWLFPFEMP